MSGFLSCSSGRRQQRVTSGNGRMSRASVARARAFIYGAARASFIDRWRTGSAGGSQSDASRPTTGLRRLRALAAQDTAAALGPATSVAPALSEDAVSIAQRTPDLDRTSNA